MCDAAAIYQRNEISLIFFVLNVGTDIEITCNIDFCSVTIVNQQAVEL
jgi:hypothetical protein